MWMFRLLRLSLCGLATLCLTDLSARPSRAQDVRPALSSRPVTLSACPEVPREDSLPALCVPPSTEEEPKPTVIVTLQIPSGTPLRIALDERTRIAHPGTAIHGRIVEPVYAFDEIVIPAGSLVTGHVSQIAPVSALRRTMSYTNGDFSPDHKYEVAFDTLTLPNGKQLAIPSTASPATAEMVHLVSRPEREQAEKKKNAAARAVADAKQDTADKFHGAMDEIRSPGRMQRMEQWLVARLPYHKQYLQPGTRFNASLNEPLYFGVATRTEAQLALLGSAIPPDSLMHARLVLEVSSASATRGNPVLAILTEPVYSPDHYLILPAETRLIGEVLQARPARKLHRNGELRVMFEHLETPDGALRPVQGSLEGIEVDRAAHLKLDEEGGAHATDSKTRYLSTGFAIAVAALASHPDYERGTIDPGGDPAVRAGAGGSGFGLAGSLISLAARSTPVSIAFGVYGASSSIYTNFLSRGHEVVLQRDTALEIGFGTPHPAPKEAASHP